MGMFLDSDRVPAMCALRSLRSDSILSYLRASIVFFGAVAVFAIQSPAFGNADGDVSDSTNYSWQLDPASRARIFEGMKALLYGETIAETKAKLGNPTNETDIVDKQGSFKYHQILYAISRINPEGGNVKDQEIQLDFDKEGRLFQVVYSALTPIAGKVLRSEVEPQTGARVFVTRPPQP